MLTTIQRQIARDILGMFLISLTVITFLVMVIGVAREALNQGLDVLAVLRLIPYALPNALSFAVPGTALFSVCCVYGRMSAENELNAMQSVGVSPLPAMLPAIVITTLLSVATVGLINTAFTWGFHGVQHVVLSSVEHIAYGKLERDRTFQRGRFSLMVRDIEGRRLIDPRIAIRRVSGEPISIVAMEAVMTYDSTDEAIEMSLTNGCVTVPGRASFVFPDTHVQTIPLEIRPSYDLLTANPSHMPMTDLSPASIEQNLDIHRREGEIAVHAGFNILTARPENLLNAEALGRESSLINSRKRLKRLGTEIHRRWASGFTCLAMSMVGIPLAIRLKTSDTMTAFGIVFLPTIIVYYPIFALTLDMAKDGRIAPYGVWLANGVFATASLLMMRKIIYSPT
ncbi:LptF/LptG family permease [Planctomycetes bacterium TBK1r]|uniref:Permease YjgP/YjgQ family protein n=1 Tax=Stieleria magnilauensis TaxID=2527963 RepID=A0ABX5XUL8_9BACT|nr:putative permease YjgP/YjgQ family protein [Planctomycetes bacterium TBK1r]